jgi:hypothetical protein
MAFCTRNYASFLNLPVRVGKRYLSFELGEKDRTLGFTIGLGQEPRKLPLDTCWPGLLDAGTL